MKRVYIICLLLVSISCFSQTAKRIKDLTTETTASSSLYFVVDRSDYSVLHNIYLSTLKTFINTGYAPLLSPVFTGTPTTTSPLSSDSSTKIPNTGWVKRYVSTGSGLSTVPYKVKVNSTDLTNGYLADKIFGSTGISVSTAVSGTASGTIVNITNNVTDISDLGDVSVYGAVNGDALMWDSSIQHWVPASRLGSGTVTFTGTSMDAAVRDGMLMQYDSLRGVMKPVSMTVFGGGAPSANAAFIGQMYIDSAGGVNNVYISINKSGSWTKIN